MECEKKSKGLMTELLNEEDIHNHKPHHLEWFLEVLHTAIQKGRDNEIIEKNFVTIYEAIQNNLGLNLEPFQKTYESLREKYKISASGLVKE